MQIQINTDHNIDGREALSAHVRKVVERALNHDRAHITRVEIHLTDENGPKTAPDALRCAMEARLEGHQPLVVTSDAATLHQAIERAADKLARLVEHTLGRQRDISSERTDPMPPEAKLPV